MPLDMNTLRAPQTLFAGPRSLPVGCHRGFTLKRPLRLSWRQVYRQFGAEPSKASDKYTVRNFRTDCLRELKKIQTAWPDLNYSTAKGVLILSPSESAIPPTRQLRLQEEENR